MLIKSWYKMEKLQGSSCKMDAAAMTKAQAVASPVLQRLIDFLTSDPSMLEMLFDYVKVSEVESEELATSLVFIFSSMGKGHELIQQAIRSSTAHVRDGLLLRGMSFNMSVLSEYARCWGKKYLSTILKGPLQCLLSSKARFEIDPKRLAEGEKLEENRDQLAEQVGQIIRNVTASQPPEEIASVLRLLLKSLRNEKSTASTSGYLLISTFLFLRFICPAIVSPHLYGLRKKKTTLNKHQQRNLILCAKVIQNIANRTTTTDKEHYLSVLTSFIEESIDRVNSWTNQFLGTVLSPGGAPSAKMKRVNIEPYTAKIRAFLMQNEDDIRSRFEKSSVRQWGASTMLSMDYNRTRDIFLEHMDNLRKELGCSPESAESYEKVWERAERRMKRFEQLTGSQQYPLGKSSSYEDLCGSSSSLSFSSSSEDTKEDLDEVRESVLSQTDNNINPDSNVIFKCWRGSQKKLVILPLAVINYDSLSSAIAKKFSLSDPRALKLNPKNNHQLKSIHSNETLAHFLHTSGTIAENTVIYSLDIS